MSFRQILAERLLRRHQSALPIAVSYHPLHRLRRHNSDRSIYRNEEDWYQIKADFLGDLCEVPPKGKDHVLWEKEVYWLPVLPD